MKSLDGAEVTLTIYRFAVAGDQEWILPDDDDHFEMFFAMDGSVIANWHPPAMKIYGEEKTYSDFPWHGEHAPFLRAPAVEALKPILQKHGQLLPIRGADAWFFNATIVLDALDEERSKIVRFDDGSILDIEHHVFNADIIGTVDMFKRPGRASPVYVTGRFVEQVRSAELRGVAFRELWRAPTNE